MAPSLLKGSDSSSSSSCSSSSNIDSSIIFSNNWKNSFYFLFTSSNFLRTKKTLSWGDIRKFGFLPRGLYERLICKAVNWSQLTVSEYTDINLSQLYKDVAILFFFFL